MSKHEDIRFACKNLVKDIAELKNSYDKNDLSDSEMIIWKQKWNELAKIYDEERDRPITFPLQNIGNSCYISVLLQILATIHTNYEHMFEKGNLTKMMKALKSLQSTKIQTKFQKFCTGLKHKHKLTEDQYDANEVFLYCIEDYKFLESLFGMDMIISTIDSQGNRIGQRRLQTSYQYQFINYSDDDINLQTYLEENRIRIEERNQNKEAIMYDVTSNEVICFQIQRFDYEDNRPVKKKFLLAIPDTLEGSLITRTCSHNYNLIGIIIHEGDSIAEGHFHCCVKQKQKWWKFDDLVEEPEEIDEEEVHTCEAYMIFFTKM